MSSVWAFFAGAVFVIICMLVSSMVQGESLTIPHGRLVLPDRLRILAEHGQERPRTRPSAVLPRRVPGATIHGEIPVSIHVMPRQRPGLTDVLSTVRTLIVKIAVRYVNDVGRWVMSSITDPDFTEWWEQSCANERKRQYHGRRRYEEVSLRTDWRKRWSEYDTQSWPTLATSGNAWDLVPTLGSMSEKALVICTGMTFNTTTQVMPVEHVARNLSENPRLLHSVA